MHEKVDRNQRLWEYHLKHPNTGCTKLGRLFHHTKDGKQVPLSPSAVWRIIKRYEKRSTCQLCGEPSTNNEVHNECAEREAFLASKQGVK